jgi:inner membrane transporter RhtA
MMSSPRPGGSIGTPVALIIGSCVSLQFGAALAVQLFPQLGPWGVTALRLTVAAIVLVIAVRPQVRAWSKQQWIAISWFGLSLAGMNGFFYAALSRIPLGPAVAIEFLGPLVLAAVLSRSAVDFTGVGIAVAGIALFGLDGILGAEPLDPLGVGFVLVAASFWALYIRKSARVGELVPGVGGLAMALVIASVLLLPFGVPAAVGVAAAPELLWLAVGTGLLASVSPYTLEFLALRRLPQRIFGILASLEPVFAALFGWLLLAQGVSGLKLVGISLVVTASIVTTLIPRKKTEPPGPPTFTGSLPIIPE